MIRCKADVRNKRCITALLLAMLLALVPLSLSSCGEADTDLSDAEEAVRAELEALKSEETKIPEFADFSEDVSEEMLASYAEKLKDFDYVISGSTKSEDTGSVIVSVDVNTYDFGSVYLETWNDRMKIEEDLRYDNQFYNDLFTRFAALSVKGYTGQANIICTKDENGEWTTDMKTSPSLMDALSGGMVAEMQELSEES